MAEPLAERMRPRTLDDYIGQKHLVGEGAVLRGMIDAGRISSFILWGPPGVGKTTLAQIIANKLETPFYTLSAVTSAHSLHRRDTSLQQKPARLASRGGGERHSDAYWRHNREPFVRGDSPFALAMPALCA